MGLSVGIVGLPNVGKSTLLNALTRAGAEASNYPFCTIDQNVGMAPVPDTDLKRLASILHPQSVAPTTIRFVDIAGLISGASRGEGLGNKFLGHIREVDAVLHVVRCFEDDNIVHSTADIDPVRDVEVVETELLLADLETARRGLEKWNRARKAGTGVGADEVAAFTKMVDGLQKGIAVSAMDLTEREAEIAREMRFLTAKPILYVANTGEDDPEGKGPLAQALIGARSAQRVLLVSVEIEEEISQLPPQEQQEFLTQMGLEKTALDLVITGCYRLLDLITFYTIANDKLQAWQLPRGGHAAQAAGRIHSDMETGFIKAEVMKLADLIEHGDRHALHDLGLLHVVGRDHVIEDKDVLQIHFKV